MFLLALKVEYTDKEGKPFVTIGRNLSSIILMELKPNEIEIEVRAVAANFRDVLSAFEKAFDGGDKIGSEDAGTVRRVRFGASDTEFQLRHRVCTAIIMFYTGGTTFFLRPAY